MYGIWNMKVSSNLIFLISILTIAVAIFSAVSRRQRSTTLTSPSSAFTSSFRVQDYIMTAVIDHIVLLKARPDVTEEEIQRFINGVKSLNTIPGVISITVGSTFAEDWMPDRRDGITHTLSCRLESKEALKAYQIHPLHVKVRDETIVPILAGPPTAVDYESVVVLGKDQER